MVDEAEERELLRQAAACAGSRFIVSYSRIELGTGRARVPSLYADEVMWRRSRKRLRSTRVAEGSEARVQTTLAWPAPHALQDAIDDMEYDLVFFANPSRPGR